MSSIYVLPPELLDLIISHLSHADHKSLRLTCHALSDCAGRWLFRSVMVRYDRFLDCPYIIKVLFDQHAPIIRWLSLYDVADFNARKKGLSIFFEALPFLKRMASLECLFYLADLPTLFRRDHPIIGQFESLMLQASLLTPPAERILPQLRSLILNNWKSSVDDYWHLDDLAVVFIIPTLENLELEYLVLCDQDPKLPASFDLSRHRTNLKSLMITNTHFDTTALEKILSIPRALTRVEFSHRNPASQEPPGGWPEESFILHERVYRAVLQHGASLEELIMRCFIGFRPENAFDLSLERFPRLQSYWGNFLDSSGRFGGSPILGKSG